METCFRDFGFYTVNIDYIKHLYSKDTQVFYDTTPTYEKKPHLGILARLGGYLYCIPLTSSKSKQLQWKNITEHNYLIYEVVSASELCTNDIFKKIGKDEDDTYKKLLGALEIKKMIPVNESLCSRVDFKKVSDAAYLSLLQKEYNFLFPHKDTILEKAKKLYVKLKLTQRLS